MGKEQETTTTTDSKSQNKIPGWLEDASKNITGQALDLSNQKFVPYKDPRVADFNADQQTGFQMVRDMVSGAPNLLPETLDMARTYANAGPQLLPDLGRIVDEGGPLGLMADYFDPYLKAAEGPLQTALRRIDEASQQNHKGISRQATLGTGDPFSDLRVALMETENEKNRMTARGDVTGSMIRDAIIQGMGARGNDLNRFYNQGVQQAGLNETALRRLLEGGRSMLGFQGADQAQDLQRIAAQLGMGREQQANKQAGLDAKYQDFLRKMGWDADNLRIAASVIGGVPHSTTSTSQGTTTQTAPDNSMWQLAGTLAGAALAPATGGMSLLPSLSGVASGGLMPATTSTFPV